MDSKRKRMVMIMLVSLVLAIILPGRLFTASGAELNPKFVTSIISIGEKVSQLSASLISSKKPMPTAPPTFTIFTLGDRATNSDYLSHCCSY